jgi:hypothetical protein
VPDSYEDDFETEDDPEAQPPDVSRRSRGVALGLGIVGGIFGLHRFYVDKPKTAIAMILTLGGLGVWYLYDVVLIAAGEFRDSNDLPLRDWGVGLVASASHELRGRVDRRFAELEDQLDAVRQQCNELAERLDFAERMLAQKRSLESGGKNQAPRLPGPGS